MEVLFSDSIGLFAPFGQSVVVCGDVSTNIDTVLHTEGIMSVYNVPNNFMALRGVYLRKQLI